jgi:hypothetical protein
MKLPITQRALVARLRRVLRPEERDVRESTAAQRKKYGLGRFYAVDNKKGSITDKDIDLEKLARSLNVLEPWEKLE